MEFDLKISAIRIWSLGFSSVAIGALALTALCFGLARGNRQLRMALVLTCLSAICVLATHGPFALLVLREAAGQQWPFELRWPAIMLGEALVGLLWLSVMVLFEDVRITPLRFAPAALLMAISLGSILTDFRGVFSWLAVAANVAIAAHAFACVAQGWRGDLVEKRRRLRRPLLLVLGLVLALVLITQGAEFASRATMTEIDPVYAVLNVALAVMALATGMLFLEPRIALLAEPAPRSATETDDSGDDAVLAELDTLMTTSEVWRREGLTVGALAAEVGMPEHRLRVLINGRLGHRNFAAFINARRIDTARRQLADPAFADTPVSKIAYDLGFASLGPFNRAFKEATGATPTEWRRAKQPAMSD
jgi:AraC-like DNA-binding protein